ncbi:MAG: hypothetical protein JWR06_1656, partial [Jatrophihabitans sp.]|nr:hypothetical protein [Jatrophihabitans sp.]
TAGAAACALTGGTARRASWHVPAMKKGLPRLDSNQEPFD